MMNLKNLKKTDIEIYKLVMSEKKRQVEGLEMIPSENYVSASVLNALGTILTNKYSEGYPKKRYYGGNEFIDDIELLAQARAKKLFNVEYVNVQPYSGSPANQAVMFALLELGDTTMGLNLADGGHLTHAYNLSFSGRYYNALSYHVTSNGKVDLEEVERLALEHKPKLIWVGGSAYTYEFEFEEFAKIADKVGAYLVADIAHVAGLIAGGVYTDPTPYAHVITTTTHKTLRGPRGAMIMVTKKGLEKDPEISAKIDKAIIPGLQGGPHNHQTAAIAVALKEVGESEFKDYASQILKNAKVLAKVLSEGGLNLVSGTTTNHLMLVDLSVTHGVGCGKLAEKALEIAGITVNKNVVPKDASSPLYPSGIRLGTPALTSRGMVESDMERVGKWILEALNELPKVDLSKDKEERLQYLKTTQKALKANRRLKEIKKEVKEFAKSFPVPGI